MNNNTNQPSLTLALVPVVLLVSGLVFNVVFIPGSALDGPSQLILILCSAIAMGLGVYRGIAWYRIMHHVARSVESVFPAILMLMLVGGLVSSWMVAGIVPAMIYYGLDILNPAWFLVSACLGCAIVAIASGSSWTTIATVGVALIGIGVGMGFDAPLVAGAVISGAYFGDKISPLSDTTNLAAGMARIDVFVHIRYLLYTTVPSILIALAVFGILGSLESSAGGSVDTSAIQRSLVGAFDLSPLLLLIPALVIALIILRIPALPAIFAGMLIGLFTACLFQRDVLLAFGAYPDNTVAHYYSAIQQVLTQGVSFHTGESSMDELLSTGGMAGMLNMIWLALMAILFGGAMEGVGFLQRITSAVLSWVKTSRGLIPATVGSCAFTNITASDQYLAIVLPGRMYKQTFDDLDLAPENLSRSLEDGGTVTSVLVPWNACGVFVAGVLGVATLEYLPYAVFCFVSPVMSVLYALLDIRIRRRTGSLSQTDDAQPGRLSDMAG